MWREGERMNKEDGGERIRRKNETEARALTHLPHHHHLALFTLWTRSARTQEKNEQKTERNERQPTCARACSPLTRSTCERRRKTKACEPHASRACRFQCGSHISGGGDVRRRREKNICLPFLHVDFRQTALWPSATRVKLAVTTTTKKRRAQKNGRR